MVKENRRRHEIGAFIVRHPLEYAPMKTICVASGKFSNFSKLDYSKKKPHYKSPRTNQAACAEGIKTVYYSPHTKSDELMIRGM